MAETSVLNEDNTRVIVFHKHPVSAKVLFLKWAHGGVCGFETLPELANVMDEVQLDQDKVLTHPALVVAWAERTLGLAEGSMDIEAEYLQKVDVPHGSINVYLVGIKGHDTPDEQLAAQGGTLGLITTLRGLPPAEMELLRRAYVVIMEG